MGLDWNQKNYNIYDLYYTLNMMRSDYYKANEAPQYYVDLAFDFLDSQRCSRGQSKAILCCYALCGIDSYPPS